MNSIRRYVDLQVNGYGGVDFNSDDLQEDDLHRACQALERDGVACCLATILTDNLAAMSRRIRRIADLREKDPLAKRIIAGLHVEGPFLSPKPGYRGAHPADSICLAVPAAADLLLDAGCGKIRLFTLAPEMDPDASVTRLLTKHGVIVSAGHTDASMDQLCRGIDAGLKMFTHLGNGCPIRGMDRHDNIIQRVLSLARKNHITPTFIADGVHIPFFALSNYLHIAGIERSIIVSDAMSAAGLGPGRYRLSRWEVEVTEELAAWSPDRSHLIGSALSMKQAEQNLIRMELGSYWSDLLRNNAAAILGIDPG